MPRTSFASRNATTSPQNAEFAVSSSDLVALRRHLDDDVSLSLSHTHTHTHMHIRTHTHLLSDKCALGLWFAVTAKKGYICIGITVCTGERLTSNSSLHTHAHTQTHTSAWPTSSQRRPSWPALWHPPRVALGEPKENRRRRKG